MPVIERTCFRSTLLAHCSLGLCAQVVLVPLNLRQYVSLLLGPRASADDGAAERVACAAGPPQCMLPSWEAYWPAALRVSSSLRNYIDPALQKKADARASPQMYSPPPPPLSPGRPASPQPANGPLASITAADGPSQRLGSTPKQSKAKSVVAPPSSPPPVQIWTRDLPAGTTPTALLPSASLVHVARFLNRTLLGILPHLVAPGGLSIHHPPLLYFFTSSPLFLCCCRQSLLTPRDPLGCLIVVVTSSWGGGRQALWSTTTFSKAASASGTPSTSQPCSGVASCGESFPNLRFATRDLERLMQLFSQLESPFPLAL